MGRYVFEVHNVADHTRNNHTRKRVDRRPSPFSQAGPSTTTTAMASNFKTIDEPVISVDRDARRSNGHFVTADSGQNAANYGVAQQHKYNFP